MSQPTFWLQVNKNYIFENFENLLKYLREYRYVGTEAHTDFDSSVDCMEELGDEIISSLTGTSLFRPIQLPYDTDRCIRLFAATALADRKRGKGCHKSVLSLIVFITRQPDLALEPALDKMFEVTVQCIRQTQILSLGFSWDDIRTEAYNFSRLMVRFKEMSFARPDEPSDNRYYFENHGLLCIDRNEFPVLAPMNLSGYCSELLANQFVIPGLLDFKVKKADCEKMSDFDRSFRISSKILSSLDSIKSSPARTLKDYATGDEVYIRITRKVGIAVEAESIDPSYRRISGKVHYGLKKYKIETNVIADCLKPGDVLIARKSASGFMFDLVPILEQAYLTYAEDFKGTTVMARHYSKYGQGDVWVSPEGILYYLDHKWVEYRGDDITIMYDDAIANDEAIYLDVNPKPDFELTGFAMPAWVHLDRLTQTIVADSPRYTIQDAQHNFVNEFLHYCQTEAEEKIHGSIYMTAVPLSGVQIYPMVTILNRMIASGIPSPVERLKYLTCLQMLCTMLDMVSDAEVVDEMRKFLDNTVRFAHRKDIQAVPVPESVEDIDLIRTQKQIIDILQRYERKPVIGNANLTIMTKPRSFDIQKIEKLVNASNSLLDILDDRELAQIRQAILKNLDIEDEFTYEENSRTFYGSESVNLEFKTSVVFPPENRRRYASLVSDPATQKWAILKAVCGFLNSKNGGELLIGVDDHGYARGLGNDISELFRLNLIHAPNSDSYRTYIQTLIDTAFKTADKSVDSYSISRSCVTYELETSAEGDEILRIKISPYRHGIVSFNDNNVSRPDSIEPSYVRLSGRTVPLTSEIANNLVYLAKRS